MLFRGGENMSLKRSHSNPDIMLTFLTSKVACFHSHTNYAELFWYHGLALTSTAGT